MHIGRIVLSVCTLVAATAGPIACESSTGGFDRHRMSHLYAADGDEGTYLFDVSTSAAMAEASAEAESERLRWLDEWMSWARHCPTGYTVIDRRRIEPGDANIYRHDLRYQVECTQPPAP